MKLIMTGDERDIANSAWVSTIDEAKARKRSIDEVHRVVKFLVDNHHTSPLEVVTLTFVFDHLDEDEMHLAEPLIANKYSRHSITYDGLLRKDIISIDLLNFVKVAHRKNLFDGPLWKSLTSENTFLAETLMNFGDIKPSFAEDVSNVLGNDHGMKVEVIQVHKSDLWEHSRATWRIKCPLSIAVQILRHRAGSYNMVSGRYRTILQDIYNVPNDVNDIFTKSELNEDIGEIYAMLNETNDRYLKLMKKLKNAKNNSIITNDEYKRARECARFALSEGRMTELYVTYYFSDFYNNYELLRNSTHAQTEHIWIAQQMRVLLEKHLNENFKI